MGAAATNLHALAVAVGDVPRTAMIATAKAAKGVALEEARRAGRARVSLPRRGRPDRLVSLRAVDTIRVRADGTTNLRVQGLPVGPWVWASSGTGAHLVGVGRTGARGASTAARVRRQRRGRPVWAVFGPGQVRRAPVYHPGARGRGVWAKAAARIAKVAPAIVADEVHRVVARG